MFGIYLLHAAYAVLMISFTFRIMIIPHAIVVGLMALYFIFVKGLIIAPILMFLYVVIALLMAFSMDEVWEDGTGNECIFGWVILTGNLCYVIYKWLL
ncbi:hypothetical protein [Veillonella sp. CHU110]|uniref:hypothetical protein n=1 Tax=Veillonella sp. CHU110 TaxID=2490947 RepID=UPI000F8C370D|nr:hypothetical protein [Veillonella sp. CHU110]